MINRNLFCLIFMLTLGLVAVQFSSPASAQSSVACNTAVTSVPTGPAIVSTASTPYGKVLVVGSADYAGCSLYLPHITGTEGIYGAGKVTPWGVFNTVASSP